MPPLLLLAAAAARPDADKVRRAYVGAVAIRADGVLVRSRNGSAKSKAPSCHAEIRLLKKCGRGAQVFVARVLKNGELACSRPCARCMAALRSKGIKYVTYTVGGSEWKMEAV